MRSCGECRLCCKVMAVQELDKARGKWCQHAGKGGCGIYKERPESCRAFVCRWLADEKFADHWFPAKSKMVIDAQIDENGNMTVVIHVDPQYPTRWRQQPWLGEIKKLAETGLSGITGGTWVTAVMIGNKAIPFSR